METKIFNENFSGKKTNTFKPLEYIENENGCWNVVNRHLLKNGYGKLRRNKKYTTTHRYVYENINGPIPEGLVVMHKCDNPACINPDHLSLGTQKDNLQDMKNKDRHTRGERSGTAKLTEIQVIEIKKLLEKGFTCSEIARKFNVNRETISAIKTKRTWTHLN